MQQWEYLFLEVGGDGLILREAKNMRVTTSDGRWDRTKMPKDIPGVTNQLGAER
jgi:hypothetical protein